MREKLILIDLGLLLLQAYIQRTFTKTSFYLSILQSLSQPLTLITKYYIILSTILFLNTLPQAYLGGC
jgi:hypothetical protein